MSRKIHAEEIKIKIKIKIKPRLREVWSSDPIRPINQQAHTLIGAFDCMGGYIEIVWVSGVIIAFTAIVMYICM